MRRTNGLIPADQRELPQDNLRSPAFADYKLPLRINGQPIQAFCLALISGAAEVVTPNIPEQIVVAYLFLISSSHLKNRPKEKGHDLKIVPSRL